MFTKTVIVNNENPTADLGIIREAAEVIKKGGLVAFPTETVYGLGASAENKDAIERIFTVKGRPADNPLIVHVSDVNMMLRITRDVPNSAFLLANAFWPGPLTLVLKKNRCIPEVVTRGLDTIAIRIPNNSVAVALIENAGAIAAPSANVSGRPSPTRASHVEYDLNGKIEMIIDGGACGVGLESTIIDLTACTPVILRPGGITLPMIRSVIGDISISNNTHTDKPKAPGMKYTHYSPVAEVVVITGKPECCIREINKRIAENPDIATGVLSTEETHGHYKGAVLELVSGSRKNPNDIARNLYKCLRKFDHHGCSRIYAEGLAGDGVEEAVMNRLVKAAGGNVINTETMEGI